MLSLRANVTIYFIANIAVAVIPFLLMPVLTRYLGPEGYGIVAMFLTLTTMLGAIVGLNSHNGLTIRWFDRDDINFPQYVSACVLILIASALFVLFFFIGFQSALVSKLSITPFWLYSTIVVSVSAFIVQIRLALWQAQEKPINYGCLQFLQAFFNGSLSFILVVFFLRGFDGRLWGQVVAVTLFGLLSILLLYRDGLLKFKTKWKYIKDALFFGVPLIPHVIGGYFLLIADRMIVNAKLGTTNAGIYMVAVQIALGFDLMNESFNKAFVPWLFVRLKSDDAAQKDFIVNLTYTYFLLLLTAPLITFFFGKHLISILAGSDFQAAAPVLTLLVLMQSLHGMYYLVTNYLFYRRKTYITSGITIISGSVGLVLTLFLVDKFGLVGAGISSVLGMLLQFLLTWFMAARAYPMPWFSSGIFQIKRLIMRQYK